MTFFDFHFVCLVVNSGSLNSKKQPDFPTKSPKFLSKICTFKKYFYFIPFAKNFRGQITRFAGIFHFASVPMDASNQGGPRASRIVFFHTLCSKTWFSCQTFGFWFISKFLPKFWQLVLAKNQGFCRFFGWAAVPEKVGFKSRRKR